MIVLENREKCNIRVGALGIIEFDRGFYAYIGSMFGPGGLESRIRRYFLGGRKHWHVDYILDYMRIIEVFVLPEKHYESFLANTTIRGLKFKFIKGFGCSDRKQDVSHLLYFREEYELERFRKFIRSIGFKVFKL